MMMNREEILRNTSGLLGYRLAVREDLIPGAELFVYQVVVNDWHNTTKPPAPFTVRRVDHHHMGPDLYLFYSFTGCGESFTSLDWILAEEIEFKWSDLVSYPSIRLYLVKL